MGPVEPEGPGSSVGADHAVTALGALSEGAVVQLASGEIVDCNRTAERILGLPRDRLIGRTSLDPSGAVHEDGSPFPDETQPAMVSLRTGSALRGIVMGIRAPDGSLRWISISSEPILGPEGKPPSVVTTFVAITDREVTEHALAREKEAFREVFENSGAAIFLTDATGSVVKVNPAACEMLGRSEEEILRLGRRGILDENDPRLPAALAERERTGTFRGELNHVRSDGSVFPAEVVSTVFRDASGATRSSTITRDISDRKRIEEKLRQSEETYRGLFDNMRNGLAYCRMIFEGDRPVDWI